MANIILGYIVIGLILSGLYVWKANDTETMRLLSRTRYISTLTFTVAVITFFWLPIVIFSFITTFIRIGREQREENNSEDSDE